jgi:hypothetical protein
MFDSSSESPPSQTKPYKDTGQMVHGHLEKSQFHVHNVRGQKKPTISANISREVSSFTDLDIQ